MWLQFIMKSKQITIMNLYIRQRLAQLQNWIFEKGIAWKDQIANRFKGCGIITVNLFNKLVS